MSAKPFTLTLTLVGLVLAASTAANASLIVSRSTPNPGGAGAAAPPLFFISGAGVHRRVTPIQTDLSLAEFYQEQVFPDPDTGQVFFVETDSGQLGIGVAIGGGSTQGPVQVVVSGLPDGASVAFSDPADRLAQGAIPGTVTGGFDWGGAGSGGIVDLGTALPDGVLAAVDISSPNGAAWTFVSGAGGAQTPEVALSALTKRGQGRPGSDGTGWVVTPFETTAVPRSFEGVARFRSLEATAVPTPAPFVLLGAVLPAVLASRRKVPAKVRGSA